MNFNLESMTGLLVSIVLRFLVRLGKKPPTNGCQFIFRFSMFNVSMYSDYARE